SQYCIHLEEKQKLTFHYGIKERQLFKYVCIDIKTKGFTSMAPIILKTRQLVNHQHKFINDRTINISSYHCKPQDFITIKDWQKSQVIITRSMDIPK
ncbi:hypothetical protein BDL97_02G001300, partial [Sphagnum fallax]